MQPRALRLQDLLLFYIPQHVRHHHSSLTSQAAAIGWIYFSAIYFESPAPWDVHVGCLLYIDYVWGSGAWDAEEVADISAVEASLTWIESRFCQASCCRKAALQFCTSLHPAMISRHAVLMGLFRNLFSGSLDASENSTGTTSRTDLCLHIYAHINANMCSWAWLKPRRDSSMPVAFKTHLSSTFLADGVAVAWLLAPNSAMPIYSARDAEGTGDTKKHRYIRKAVGSHPRAGEGAKASPGPSPHRAQSGGPLHWPSPWSS